MWLRLGMVSVWSIAGVDQEFSQEVMCWLYTQRSMGFSWKKTLVVGVWVQTFNYVVRKLVYDEVKIWCYGVSCPVVHAPFTSRGA